ncbi:MAG: energy transducer TonB [Bacteroidota bacterium]
MNKKFVSICALLLPFALPAIGLLDWHAPKEDPPKAGTCQSLPAGPSAVSQVLMSGLRTEERLDLVYEVEPRFLARVTKDQLDRATSILEILPPEATQNIKRYEDVAVSVSYTGGKIVQLEGDGAELTPGQKVLLQSADCGSHLYISGYIYQPFTGSTELYGEQLTYYVSVIPHVQAKYEAGHQALISHLKESFWINTLIIQRDQVKPGEVRFTVTAEGTIEDARSEATCGYPSLDLELVRLIQDLPGKWIPATNEAGKKVSQELTFFFGDMGC